MGKQGREWVNTFTRYELEGEDRAQYGDKLFDSLASSLEQLGVEGCGKRQLYQFRNFVQTYPQIVRALTPQFTALLPPDSGVDQPDEKSAIVRSSTAQFLLPAEKLLNSLSYTHLEQLFVIDDSLRRAFYEVECVRGGWSVRQLKRQIGSLYFERSALSKDKAALAKQLSPWPKQTSRVWCFATRPSSIFSECVRRKRC